MVSERAGLPDFLLQPTSFSVAVLAVVAGALFFIGDIYILALIFRQLFARVGEAAQQAEFGHDSAGLVAGDSEPTTAAPVASSRTPLSLLVLLKLIVLFPVLIALLSVFSEHTAALFGGMFCGLVFICIWLFFSHRSKRVRES